MNFNLENDFGIFEPIFKKRPEVSRNGLKAELAHYYLPYVDKLLELKEQKEPGTGILVGVSAIQGAGKSTQGEILEILFGHRGFATCSLSIDDHYITHHELDALRKRDPRFVRRGVTHDIQLAGDQLKQLQAMADGEVVLIAGYDKGAHQGDGDRFRWINPIEGLRMSATVGSGALHIDSADFRGRPLKLPDDMGADISLVELPSSSGLRELRHEQGEVSVTMGEGDTVVFDGTSSRMVKKADLPNGWRVIAQKPNFIFYDGWMLGARRVEDESVFDSGLPALETPEARQFAKDVNQKLTDYEALWGMLDFLTVLYVANYGISIQWRNQAEEALRRKGQGMTYDQIAEFVHYFWRSVHPAIHIKNLAHDTVHTQQVAIINDDHSVADVVNPAQVT